MTSKSWKDNFIGRHIKKSQPIFRIVKYKHLLEALKTNETYFSWPPKWKDRFDSVFFKTPFIDDAGNLPCWHGVFDQIYCQCWCKKESESDAMWRLYSNEETITELDSNNHFTGLMIVSDVGKMMESIWDENDKFNRFRYFCGKVKYVKQDCFYEELFFNNEVGDYFTLYNNSDHRPLMQTILYKANSYDHEHEIRFIHWNSDLPPRQDGVLIKHHPTFASIVSKIIVDPRTDEMFCNFIKSKIHSIDNSIIVEKSEMARKLPKNYVLTGVAEMNKPYKSSST